MTAKTRFAKTLAITLAAILLVSIVYGAVRLGMHIAEKRAAREEASAADGDRGGEKESGVPQEIEIGANAAFIVFREGDAFAVDGADSLYTVAREGAKLRITSDISRISEARSHTLTITVPARTRFRSVTVNLRSGSLNARGLKAKAAAFDLFAGSAELTDPDFSESVAISADAGSVYVQGGVLANLRLRCGAGAARISAKLTGSSSVECGAGATSLVLYGAESDYAVSFRLGLGGAEFNGRRVSSNATYSDGPAQVEVRCSLGYVTVNTVAQ